MTFVLIGPRYSEKGALGGIVVLFENLLSQNCSTNRVAYIIDSNSKNYPNIIIMLVNVIFQIVRFWRVHISLHGTEKDFKFFGTFLLLRRILGGGGYSLRKFAGNYDDYYEKYNYLTKIIVTKVLEKSSCNFFETLSLVDKFRQFNQNTFWFPNVRSASNSKSIHYTKNEVFKVLYVSQVREEKGILDLIDAIRDCSSLSLTIVGRIINGVIDPKALPNNVTYIGELPQSEISQLMLRHHVLALPTFYPGEGYPGVIIEAFMVGLPVITTKWKAIPELVSDAAYLVQPLDSTQILNAIFDLKNSTHAEYQVRAKKRSLSFSDLNATDKYWSNIESNI